MSRMLASLGGLVCLGLAGAAGYVAFTTAEPAPAAAPLPPRAALVVEQPLHDFGVVGQMETLQAEFRLVNHFPTAVTINEKKEGEQ